jgi:hypothetical protein
MTTENTVNIEPPSYSAANVVNERKTATNTFGLAAWSSLLLASFLLGFLFPPLWLLTIFCTPPFWYHLGRLFFLSVRRVIDEAKS